MKMIIKTNCSHSVYSETGTEYEYIVMSLCWNDSSWWSYGQMACSLGNQYIKCNSFGFDN